MSELITSIEVSVVIPVYNASQSLVELHSRLSKVLKHHFKSFEIIYVDDYSKDDSWQVLDRLKASDPDFTRILRLAKNYGQHNATFCGCKYAQGSLIVTIDDDLQNLPEEIPLLFERHKMHSADLIYGVGAAKKSTMRKAGSRLWKWGSRTIEDSHGQGSSFRLIKRELLLKILGHNQHFIYIDELLNWYTNYIEYVPVIFQERKSGSTGYSIGRLFRLIKSTTFLYGSWPLKLMTYGGLVLSFLSFLFAIRFIYIRLVFGVVTPGFTVTIVAVLFSTSVILICFGILGKYLRDVYVLLNKKPIYSIKELKL